MKIYMCFTTSKPEELHGVSFGMCIRGKREMLIRAVSCHGYLHLCDTGHGNCLAPISLTIMWDYKTDAVK